jgi:hypothetical protein
LNVPASPQAVQRRVFLRFGRQTSTASELHVHWQRDGDRPLSSRKHLVKTSLQDARQLPGRLPRHTRFASFERAEEVGVLAPLNFLSTPTPFICTCVSPEIWKTARWNPQSRGKPIAVFSAPGPMA